MGCRSLLLAAVPAAAQRGRLFEGPIIRRGMLPTAFCHGFRRFPFSIKKRL
jgi:hypothetical protein